VDVAGNTTPAGKRRTTAMLTPKVTEIRRPLEAVTPDTFIAFRPELARLAPGMLMAAPARG